MKPFLIIKTGSTLPSVQQQFGDFEDWMTDGLGLTGARVPVVNVMAGETLPPADRLSGALITGSPAMVTDQAVWMRNLATWIPEVVARQLPLLGVCFGHQVLAEAMGGVVDYHPEGREIGTVAINLTEEGRRDPLLDYFPKTFMAHATHAQTVARLPANAVLLAENRFEAHHAFRLGECAWGVQFHPEFTVEIMRAYVVGQLDLLTKQGHDVGAIQSAIADTEAANALLKRFYAYCAGRQVR